MKFDTLYKTDSKNKTREWNVTVVDLGDHAEIIVTHGAKNGQMQEKVTEIWEGKNLGKKNETSYLEQAIFESKSKWLKQQDKGYNTVIGEKEFLPMLAKNFKDHTNKVVYPCYVQPKLDGLRSTTSLEIDNIISRSRKNKIWNTIEHILEAVSDFLKKNTNIVLDGEIYCDPQVMSFQKICSAIKRDKANEESLKAELWCYDIYDKNRPELTFEERLKLIPNLGKPFIQVKTILCHNEEEVFENHKNFVKSGYEGSIVRNMSGTYKVDGRSFDLLKLKDFQDGEYKIIGKELDKNRETIFICLDEKTNKEFNCKPEGSHEERLNYYKEDNIGKYLTVRFFDFTSDGLPRFGVGVCVRDYE